MNDGDLVRITTGEKEGMTGVIVQLSPFYFKLVLTSTSQAVMVPRCDVALVSRERLSAADFRIRTRKVV